jgi:hypothetical protein
MEFFRSLKKLSSAESELEFLGVALCGWRKNSRQKNNKISRSIETRSKHNLCEVSQIFFPACYRIPFYFPYLSPIPFSPCSLHSCAALVLLLNQKILFSKLEDQKTSIGNYESKKSFFLSPDNFSILKITDSAADSMNCTFSNSLLEDPAAAAAAVSFDVTVLLVLMSSHQIFLNVILQQTLMAAWLHHQKVFMAYDSITNQIYLTDALK